MKFNIERLDDGRLRVLNGDGVPRYAGVQRCFPWSEPDQYISLRDDNDVEIALVATLDDLDPRSRDAVRAALEEAGFVFNVQSIQAIETEFEIRVWQVTAIQGALRFQTRLDEWPRASRDGSLLLRDVAGNLIRFSRPETLDVASRKLLWSYLE